jgi:cytochrome c556
LAAAGRAAYKAAQSKSMDEMIAVSETVSAACAKCHEPYRDFDEPKDRCKTAATAE